MFAITVNVYIYTYELITNAFAQMCFSQISRSLHRVENVSKNSVCRATRGVYKVSADGGEKKHHRIFASQMLGQENLVQKQYSNRIDTYEQHQQ